MNFSKDNIAIKSLTNALKTNKLSHAYLMVGEDSLYCDEFILQFVKSIFCLENNDKEFYNCGECKACQSIEHNNYVDFYIIESETSIKKEESQNLKSELSLLKFLEEPEDDIIAILSCKNISAVIPTIISRCQQVKLTGSSEEITEEIDENLLEYHNEFLKRFSRKPHLTNIYLLEKLKTKEDILSYFTLLNKKITISYLSKDKVKDVKNISLVQEKVLLAINDIKNNVSAVLVLEKFLFSVVLDNNSLEFLKEG